MSASPAPSDLPPPPRRSPGLSRPRPLRSARTAFLARWRALPASKIHGWIAGLNALLIAGLIVVWFWPQTARFSANALVEKASIKLTPEIGVPDWGPLPVTLPVGPATCATPHLQLPEDLARPINVAFTVEDGALQLVLESAGSLGSLVCADGTRRDAGSTAIVRLATAAGQALTLRLAGELTLGSEVKAGGGARRLLREGTLIAEADSWPFGTGKAGATTPLSLGDRVRFYRDDDHEAPAFGLLRMSDDALRVVAYSTGREAQVLRAGQDRVLPVAVAPSFLARLQAQAEWGILGIAGAVLINILTALAAIADRRAGHEEPE